MKLCVPLSPGDLVANEIIYTITNIAFFHQVKKTPGFTKIFWAITNYKKINVNHSKRYY